jgi:hypothetical protein
MNTTIPPSPWPRRIVTYGAVWGAAQLLIILLAQPTPENGALAVAVMLSGTLTYTLYNTRDSWLPRLASDPLRNAFLLGVANATALEVMIVVVEKFLGAKGVAANPNLLLDLIITVPWYVVLVRSFVQVQHRRRFPPAVVLLLGAIYELGADGFVGGFDALLDPTYWLLLIFMAFWWFIPTYSALVLPPSWLIAKLPPPPPATTPAWRDALRPLLWLIPYSGYLLLLGVVFGG